jgi:hypothetical protein
LTGCNELIFNPLIHWWRLGPINKQLRIFVWSDAPVHYKIGMMSCELFGLFSSEISPNTEVDMFSYYALAGSAVLSFINYIILGWSFNIDHFYEHSFEVWLACIVTFPVAGNVGFTLLEYRLGQRSLLDSLVENVTWVPFL